MIKNFRNNHNKEILIKILFYIYPLVMLRQSTYITVYVTLLTIFSFYFFYKNRIKINFFFLDYLVFTILLLAILSTLINVQKLGYFLLFKSILDVRFGFLYLIIRNLFYYKIIKFIPIVIMTCIATIFLSFDIFIQHIYGQDLLGYKPWNDRYAGIFNDEAIAGSYIQKFAFISIPLILFIKKSNLLKITVITFLIIILGLGILMSTDRMPLIIYLMQLLMLIFFANKLKITYLINFIILFSLIFLIFHNNKIINKRYESLYSLKDSIISKNINTEELKKNSSTFESFNNSNNYLNIFYTGYEIWKKNPIIGTGVKSFNISCSEASTANNKLLCSPHAHNLYLEILINTGIFGILIFIIYIFNMLKDVKSILSKHNNTIYLYLLIIFIAELFPFRSYGSIFQTVNGSMFWYLLALTSVIKFREKLIKY